MLEAIKKELLNSLNEIEDEVERRLDEMVGQIKNPEEAAGEIKLYENMLTTKNVKIINIVAKQGQLLQQFKELEEFSESVRLSRSTIYFKISLFKFLLKYPLLKTSCLSSRYFENILRKRKKGI